METTPAIEQATCTDCDETDPEEVEFAVIERDHEMMPDDEEEGHVTRTVRCKSCKSEGEVRVTHDGSEPSGCVSFEHASWNQEDESDDEE